MHRETFESPWRLAKPKDEARREKGEGRREKGEGRREKAHTHRAPNAAPR
jgi:hypothetical protein